MKTTLLIFVLTALCCGAQEASQPITFRYVRDSDLKEKPPLPIGMIFWVTNNTAFPQSIVVLGLQVKKGSNWVNLPPMETPDEIKFSPPGPLTGVPRYYPTQLEPHAAGYGCVMIDLPLAGTTWRVKAVAQRPLSGFEAEQAASNIKALPLAEGTSTRTNVRIWGNRFSGGYISFMEPSPTKTTYFDKPVPALSQEVTQ